MFVGIDNSSASRILELPGGTLLFRRAAAAGHELILSALNVFEAAKYQSPEGRQRVMDALRDFRRASDYRVLPVPLELMDAEFDAWLNSRHELLIGDSPSSILAQQILEDATMRTEANFTTLREMVQRGQAQYRQQLRPPPASQVAALRMEGISSPQAAIDALLKNKSLVRSILSAAFGSAIPKEQPLTEEDVDTCLLACPSIRTFLAVHAVALEEHAISGRSTQPKKSPSEVDTQQCCYLPRVDVFVSEDTEHRRRLLLVNEHLKLGKLVLTAEQFLGATLLG